MAKKIIVASSKGGVGKTTVALGIAGALVGRGHRVLLCDLDFENRCLDLFMGIDRGSIYNIADVVQGRVTADKAIIRNDKGLSFISAPAGADCDEKDVLKGLPPGSLTYALQSVIDADDPDFVIFDTSAGLSVPVILAEAFKGAFAVTVASHQPASCKGAEKTARVLLENGVRDVALVINGYEQSSKKDGRSRLLDIIDSSAVRLLGVVPYDRGLMLSHEKGVMVSKGSPSDAAFKNIAARLCMESVKLFSGVRGINRKDIL